MNGVGPTAHSTVSRTVSHARKSVLVKTEIEQSPQFKAILVFRRLKDLGIDTTCKGMILLAIKNDPEITVAEIRRLTNSKRQTNVSQLQKMKEDGFVDWRMRTEEELQRKGSKHSRLFFLTEKGERVVEIAAKLIANND